MLNSAPATLESLVRQSSLRFVMAMSAGMAVAACSSAPPVAQVLPPHASCLQSQTRAVYTDPCEGFDKYGSCISGGLSLVRHESVCKQDRCEAGYQWSGGSCMTAAELDRLRIERPVLDALEAQGRLVERIRIAADDSTFEGRQGTHFNYTLKQRDGRERTVRSTAELKLGSCVSVYVDKRDRGSAYLPLGRTAIEPVAGCRWNG